MKIKKSASRKAFEVFNYTFLTLVMLVSLFPLVHMFALSFSSNAAASAGWVTIFPVDFSLEAYKYILGKPEFFRAFGISVLRVILGTSISVSLTILCAYSMSQPDHKFHGRKYYTWMFIITMVFNGGVIPTFLVIKAVGIYDTIWALILPNAVQTFNIIMMLNFFRGLPPALSESAFIDGANHFQVLLKIYLPISKPSLATVGLFTMHDLFVMELYFSISAKLLRYVKKIGFNEDVAVHTGIMNLYNISQYSNWEDVFRNLNCVVEYVFAHVDTSIENKNEDVINKVKSYIKNHLDGDTSLYVLSTHVHLCPEHLLRIFKKQEGVTILQYINDLKLAKAKQMLSGTDMQIKEIATKLGFTSAGYFGRFFKSKLGVTPNVYRDQKRK